MTVARSLSRPPHTPSIVIPIHPIRHGQASERRPDRGGRDSHPIRHGRARPGHLRTNGWPPIAESNPPHPNDATTQSPRA
jgi:hypothetical protein